MRSIWRAREFSTVVILLVEIAFFGWYLWPEAGRSHPFLNLGNFLLIFKYSSIYGIAAIGAAVVIISGGIDLAPGAIIALTTVITGYLFVVAGWPLWAGASVALAAGAFSGFVSAQLIVRARLPPFIATLGLMGILRGAAFIVTEARFYDLSAKLPRDWHIAGVSIDWLGPIVMVLLAGVFQRLMTGYQWGRSVCAVGGNETAALFSGIPVNRIKTSAYVLSGALAATSGVVLAVVQGQGKADLASGYELDIIASAVVGGASLVGGRGSVAGAVLGALIFGVLRNALPQIPGATFYDRLIVGVVVIGIVVMDQVLTRRSHAS
ncbi:MAG TPA: ABC transporter permease [Vicinamibacterales bacterium]|nr:ABC transporter permease [Vicinamibacterales bacterium]